MKQKFTDKLHLNKANKEKLARINSIIEEYQAQGLKLTLRQLYYQLVVANVIPNNDKEYGKISNLLVQGRMAGIVDWEAIEDRTRQPHIPYSVDDVEDALSDTIQQYRLDRQKGQDVYIEVWVEKDALSGVLKRTTEQYHVRLIVNRGYSSCTAMYDAANRIKYFGRHKKSVVLYLGDHDPSGVDMVRDIKKRLAEFGADVEVERIGLTMEQIKKYNPPPNPTKMKDPRSGDYIQKYGRTCWEVDALKPTILHELVKFNIELRINMTKYKAVLEQERVDRNDLQDFVDSKRY